MQLISARDTGMTAEEWDSFASSRSDSTFCHLHGWSTVMEKALGHECPYLAAADGTGAVRAILPLVRVRSALFGHYLVSMPFLNYGGALGTTEATRFLHDEATALAARSGADLLELRTRVDVDAPSLTTNTRKVTILLDLPDDAERFWKEGLGAKVRSQVRRPQKEGMVARFGVGERDPFYEVFARNMRDLGTPVLAKAFFEQIAAVLPDSVEFGAVYLGDTPVAAGCGFVWKDEFEMTWASSLREFNRRAPNMLLYWSFMERMIQRGLKVFNFGRCTPEGGTYRFKKQWGDTRDVPLPWQQWSRSGLSATPNPDGSPLFELATRVWSRLPLAVANRLGPRLSRALP
jgi:FemAB-related protein (PEP-CTERM system-associated)